MSVGERAGRPTWARYALNEDYHDTVKPGLIAAGRIMQELYGIGERDYRYYVDTGPVLERGWAARAGIGFVGKNAMLISRRHGNWLLLAAILTKVAFVADEPIRKKVENLDTKQAGEVGLLCGKCTRCLDACPTDAFVKPGVVDARRCVSYQTIENKGLFRVNCGRGSDNESMAVMSVSRCVRGTALRRKGGRCCCRCGGTLRNWSCGKSWG